MRCDDKIVAVNRQIVNRGRWQIELQRLPARAGIEGDEDTSFGSGEEKARAPRIFADGVNISSSRDSIRDARPGFPVISRGVDVRLIVVKAMAIHGYIGGACIRRWKVR